MKYILNYMLNISMVTYTDTCIAPDIIKDSFALNFAQWFARLTRNVEVVSSSPIKGPLLFP